jgi:hypothetical protein
VSDVVGVYNEKKAEVEAWGPHDPASEGTTEEVFIFSGSPKYVTEVLIDTLRWRCSGGGAT